MTAFWMWVIGLLLVDVLAYAATLAYLQRGWMMQRHAKADATVAAVLALAAGPVLLVAIGLRSGFRHGFLLWGETSPELLP